MKDNVLISVVMSCYNSKDYVRQAIKSVAVQSYKNWELIIVNDCSKDNSLEVVKNTISEFKIENKVKLINHEFNLGCGSSLSDAIKNSTGELIAILDSDDSFSSKDSLKIMVEEHIKHPEASMIYSNYWECNRMLKKIKIYKTRQLGEKETYLGSKIRISHLKVLKRSFYDKTIGVNRNLKQTVDKDLVLKLEEVGKLIHVNQDLYCYRQRSDNLTKSVNKKGKDYKTFVKIMRYKVYNDARLRRGLPLKNVEEIEEWEKNNQTCG